MKIFKKKCLPSENFFYKYLLRAQVVELVDTLS